MRRCDLGGTTEGGKLASATVKKRFGENFYVLTGAKGGKKSKRHLTHDEAIEMARRSVEVRRANKARAEAAPVIAPPVTPARKSGWSFGAWVRGGK